MAVVCFRVDRNLLARLCRFVGAGLLWDKSALGLGLLSCGCLSGDTDGVPLIQSLLEKNCLEKAPLLTTTVALTHLSCGALTD